MIGIFSFLKVHIHPLAQFLLYFVGELPPRLIPAALSFKDKISFHFSYSFRFWRGWCDVKKFLTYLCGWMGRNVNVYWGIKMMICIIIWAGHLNWKYGFFSSSLARFYFLFYFLSLPFLILSDSKLNGQWFKIIKASFLRKVEMLIRYLVWVRTFQIWFNIWKMFGSLTFVYLICDNRMNGVLLFKYWGGVMTFIGGVATFK